MGSEKRATRLDDFYFEQGREKLSSKSIRIDRSIAEVFEKHNIAVTDNIPDDIASGTKFYFAMNPSDLDYYTHSLFKFPARFFPLVPRWLIQQYSRIDDLVLDPFCGSGGALVEAKLACRRSVGIDIDPLGRFLTKVKTTPIETGKLHSLWSKLELRLEMERRERPYDPKDLAHQDITDETRTAEVTRGGLEKYLPRVDNSPPYWFRHYVFVDLGRIKKAIYETAEQQQEALQFFLACFAAIIRRSSNADPSAVSGLEYTRIMRERDERGRLVDPFDLFRRSVVKRLPQMDSFYQECRKRGATRVEARVVGEDIRNLEQDFAANRLEESSADLLVTSPPYFSAIEYYRRHKLELVWLDLLKDFDDVRELSKRYFGAYGPGPRDPTVNTHNVPELDAIIDTVRKSDKRRAGILSKYFSDMGTAFERMDWALKKEGYAGVVIGDSSTHGTSIPTTDAYLGLASKMGWRLEKRFSYLIRNRIMAFPRGDRGGKIHFENVLIFKK